MIRLPLCSYGNHKNVGLCDRLLQNGRLAYTTDSAYYDHNKVAYIEFQCLVTRGCSYRILLLQKSKRTETR